MSAPQQHHENAAHNEVAKQPSIALNFGKDPATGQDYPSLWLNRTRDYKPGVDKAMRFINTHVGCEAFLSVQSGTLRVYECDAAGNRSQEPAFVLYARARKDGGAYLAGSDQNGPFTGNVRKGDEHRQAEIVQLLHARAIENYQRAQARQQAPAPAQRNQGAPRP